MSTVVSTRHFVGKLKDLVLTASTEPLFPEVNAVLLHTTRAEITLEDMLTNGEEDEETLIDVVTTDVLVGTSTDRTIVAQAHAPCTGQLRGPVLISSAHAKKICDVFTPLWKAHPKTSPHEVALELAGEVLIVSENRATVHSPVVLSIGVLDMLGEFPHNLDSALAPAMGAEVKRDGEVVDRTWGKALTGRHLEVIGKVGKRRKMTPVIYQGHQFRPTVATVGSWWRAALLPATGVDDEALDEPLVPVFQPPFPEKKDSKKNQPQLVDAG